MYISVGEIGKGFREKCCEAKLRTKSGAGGLPREENRGALWVRCNGK